MNRPVIKRGIPLQNSSRSWIRYNPAYRNNRSYCKNPKNLDTRKISCNYPKIGTVSFYCRVMGSKDADGMTNSVDPDQIAPQGAV